MATSSSREQDTEPRKRESPAESEGKPDPTVPTIKQPESESSSNDIKEATASTTNAPLAPPPKPSQNADNDYFGSAHSQTQLSKEPNPFENAFGAPSDPQASSGKPHLPGVNSLTSPASLLRGQTPGWPGSSLRSGPLSPAMLTGPTNNNDYFSSDHHFSGSFPTPNESSLRSGLTPGGGGSMFPQPSPNSQSLYQQLQSGGATPGTLDFHRTAMTARAQASANNYNMQHNGATSQPQNPNIQPDLDSKPYNGSNSNQQQGDQDPFSSHQTNDAANGLFMLAQAGGQRNAQQQQQQHQQQHQQQQQQYPVQHQLQQSYHQHAQHDRNGKNSIASTMSGGTDGPDQYSDDGSAKASGKGRGKKSSAGKGAQNGKRKTDETPSKMQGNKRQRGSIGQPIPQDEDDIMDDDDDMGQEDGMDIKKMTDEEKRKNFLERNRVAALKCRQRKKQWLANLQQKVEIFSTENDALAATVTQLREEIVGLKTLLLAHKDCPVSQAQGISGMAMQQIAGDAANYNPYGMAMGGHGPQQAQMSQGQMQRR